MTGTVTPQHDRRRLFATARLRGPGTGARRSWQSTYVRRIVAADVVCALVSAVVGYVVRFGPAYGAPA